MWRLARALLACALLAGRAAAAILPGATLSIAWCDAADAQQLFLVGPASVATPDGALCATFAGAGAPLAMEPCAAGAPAQAWAYGAPVAGAFSAAPAGKCLSWNCMGFPGFVAPGSTVGVFECVTPAAFNGAFTPGAPAPGLISLRASSPHNSTPPGLCVAAVNPPPPPPPPVATPAQAAWAEAEMACFYHYNMATAAGTQGCDCNSAPPDISIWDPSALDTDAWISAGAAMGCKRFVYVAKHGCGATMWPSNARILGERYPYSVAFARNTTDVVASFVASAKRIGAPFGFYYSVGSNAKTHTCSGAVGRGGLPGQLNVTQEEYNQLVIDQLTELWSSYGPLGEVWFDVRGGGGALDARSRAR